MLDPRCGGDGLEPFGGDLVPAAPAGHVDRFGVLKHAVAQGRIHRCTRSIGISSGAEAGRNSRAIDSGVRRFSALCRTPRPKHRKCDPQAQAKWVERALFCRRSPPILSRQANRSLIPGRSPHRTPPGQGTLTRVGASAARAASCGAANRVSMGLCVRGGQPVDGRVVGVDCSDGEYVVDERFICG